MLRAQVAQVEPYVFRPRQGCHLGAVPRLAQPSVQFLMAAGTSSPRPSGSFGMTSDGIHRGFMEEQQATTRDRKHSLRTTTAMGRHRFIRAQNTPLAVFWVRERHIIRQ